LRVVERRLVVFLFGALVLRLAVPLDDFAAVDFRAVPFDFALLVPLFADERDDEEPVFFAAGDRLLVLLLVLRAELRPAPLLDVEPASSDHLPDITRWAASATASAISEPSLVALDITDLAALSAVSAASMPASLIALRALGLLLIAAAAAARPAASISLLIAALASFSAVDFDELEDDLDDFEPLRVLDFAIAKPPLRLPH
jgi:hypothetical protein